MRVRGSVLRWRDMFGKSDEKAKAGRESAHRYLMRERMFSIGDDFWIEDEKGRRAFKVDGKALRLRETFVMEDLQGKELVTIKKDLFAIGGSMTIERNGKPYAKVKKALINILGDRFSLEAPNREVKIDGDIIDHEYRFERGGHKVA